jgi:hypothetical protein
VEWLEVCAAIGTGDGKGQGDAMTRGTLAIDQRLAAGWAVVRRGQYRGATSGAAARKEDLALGAHGSSGEQLLIAGRAVEEQLCETPGATVVLWAHGRTAGRADGLPAIGAEAVLKVERQRTTGATAIEGALGLAAGRDRRWFFALLKAGAASRTGGCIRTNLGAAVGTVDAIGCAAP